MYCSALKFSGGPNALGERFALFRKFEGQADHERRQKNLNQTSPLLTQEMFLILRRWKEFERQEQAEKELFLKNKFKTLEIFEFEA